MLRRALDALGRKLDGKAAAARAARRKRAALSEVLNTAVEKGTSHRTLSTGSGGTPGGQRGGGPGGGPRSGSGGPASHRTWTSTTRTAPPPFFRSLPWTLDGPEADPTVRFREFDEEPIAEQEPLSGFLIQFSLFEASMAADYLALPRRLTTPQLDRLTQAVHLVPLRSFRPWVPTRSYVLPGWSCVSAPRTARSSTPGAAPPPKRPGPSGRPPRRLEALRRLDSFVWITSLSDLRAPERMLSPLGDPRPGTSQAHRGQRSPGRPRRRENSLGQRRFPHVMPGTQPNPSIASHMD